MLAEIWGAGNGSTVRKHQTGLHVCLTEAKAVRSPILNEWIGMRLGLALCSTSGDLTGNILGR